MSEPVKRFWTSALGEKYGWFGGFMHPAHLLEGGVLDKTGFESKRIGPYPTLSECYEELSNVIRKQMPHA
jgi:hypothetical protein